MTDMIGDDGCYRYSRPIFTMSSPTIQSPLQADKSSKQVQGNMPVALLSEPKKPRRNRRHAIEAATTLTPEASDASNQSSTSSPQSVVVSPRNEILPITPANATFDATPSGMPTPQSATAKAKRPEMVSDRDNIRVDSILEGIPDLKALNKVRLEQLLTTEAGQVQLDFKVSPKEFEKWKADKEEVGGYEYNYSREELIIKADGGAIHETTVHLMAWWFGNFAEGNGNLYMSLGEEFKLRDLVSGEKYTKRPDCFVRVGDQEFPRVIVEVGVTQTLDQLKRAARDWLLASNLVHLVFLIHVDKTDQVDGFNKILRSRKRRETPGRPNRYAQYKELLDGAEEDFDPAIYCDRRHFSTRNVATSMMRKPWSTSRVRVFRRRYGASFGSPDFKFGSRRTGIKIIQFRIKDFIEIMQLFIRYYRFKDELQRVIRACAN